MSDWIPKTRSEIKALLLDIANRQVNIHTQTLMGWENALKLSTDDISQMFKTVSKTAVQNLSPSKCRTLTTPNETDRDIDDMDNYSNYSDIQDVKNDGFIENNDLDIQLFKDEQISDMQELKGEHNSDIQEIKDEQYSDIQGFKDENTDIQGSDESENITQGVTNGCEKLDSIKDDSSNSKSDKFSDPLQEFSEVDLS